MMTHAHQQHCGAAEEPAEQPAGRRPTDPDSVGSCERQMWAPEVLSSEARQQDVLD